MKRTALAVLLLGVAFLLLNAGCYTVLRHPTGSQIVQEGAYYRSCADCHQDSEYYHPYSHPYYGYGRSQYGWGGYYGSPWWYDSYWWWDDDNHPHHDGGDYEPPNVEEGSRHLWSSDGWAGSGWGFVKPGSSPRAPAPSSDKNKKDEKKEEKKEDKKEKKTEDDRNLWDKPKKGF
jgi:hypothetical protein